MVEHLLRVVTFTEAQKTKFVLAAVTWDCVSAFRYFNVNATFHENKTPLHLALNGAAVYELVRLGASIDAKCSGGRFPIHTASNIEVAKALIACGSDLNVRDGNGMTPLHHYMKRKQMTPENVIRIIEECNPSIEALKGRAVPSFFAIFIFGELPKRHKECLRTILFFLWWNPCQEKNLTQFIAKLVFQSRRQPIWSK